MRLAQYSLLHHSMSRLLVSLPTEPPSDSFSLPEELSDGAGDATRLGIGEGADRTPLAINVLKGCLSTPLPFRALRAASVKVFLFPVPNFFHGCPGRVRCLLSWKIRHISFCRFFLFSESTALSSRNVPDELKSGEWKKPANRSRAPGRASDAT